MRRTHNFPIPQFRPSDPQSQPRPTHGRPLEQKTEMALPALIPTSLAARRCGTSAAAWTWRSHKACTRAWQCRRSSHEFRSQEHSSSCCCIHVDAKVLDVEPVIWVRPGELDLPKTNHEPPQQQAVRKSVQRSRNEVTRPKCAAARGHANVMRQPALRSTSTALRHRTTKIPVVAVR